MLNHLAPLVGTYAYLNYPKDARISKSALFYISAIHNSLLIVFSAWTCGSLLGAMHRHGVVFKSNYYLQFEEVDRIIFYFYISKYYEYIDTFILYLNGKNPIFLQKFHHIGAAIFWHLGYYYKVDCILYASLLNSFIHTFMYTYYLGSLLKVKNIRTMKPYLTIMQVVQLLQFPTIIYFYETETAVNYSIMFFFSCYVSVLIGLFLHFYWTSYLKPVHF